MISTFSSSDKRWWQLGRLVFSPKTVLEVITRTLAIQKALLQVCVMGCLNTRETPVSSPLIRDQEWGLSSRSCGPSIKWSLPASFSLHVSSLSAQDFCLSFSHVRLWNTLVASAVTCLETFFCTPVFLVWSKGTGISATKQLHALSHITSPQWLSEPGQSCDVLA